MILLDTNVVAELMRPPGHRTATAWLDGRDRDAMYLCAPGLAEMRYGIVRLTDGAKKRALAAAADRIEHTFFEGRILPFDQTAADEYGALVVSRERRGRPIGVIDAMIAAIALARGMTLATRNTADFEGVGLDLVDPFAEPAP